MTEQEITDVEVEMVKDETSVEQLNKNAQLEKLNARIAKRNDGTVDTTDIQNRIMVLSNVLQIKATSLKYDLNFKPKPGQEPRLIGSIEYNLLQHIDPESYNLYRQRLIELTDLL